jgi:hypothetical protein
MVLELWKFPTLLERSVDFAFSILTDITTNETSGSRRSYLLGFAASIRFFGQWRPQHDTDCILTSKGAKLFQETQPTWIS